MEAGARVGKGLSLNLRQLLASDAAVKPRSLPPKVRHVEGTSALFSSRGRGSGVLVSIHALQAWPSQADKYT